MASHRGSALLILTALLLSACGGGASQKNTSGGGTVDNPTPQIISVSPTVATAGAAGFTLSVSGSGFVSASVVNWNGSPRTTNVQSSTVVSAAISAADIASSGSGAITVVSPEPFGSVISNSINFPIKPLAPSPITGAGVIALISLANDGTAANTADLTAISSNGRYVAFVSSASNLGNNGLYNVFLRDTCTAAPTGCLSVTTPVSVALDGSPGNGNSGLFSVSPAISTDGRYVAFASDATNLVANDGNGSTDIFLRDTCTGAAPGCAPSTIRVSVAFDGSESNGNSLNPAISADGRFVAYDSDATNLVPNDSNSATDVFVRDTCTGAQGGCVPSTTCLSVALDGTLGNATSFYPAMSGTGRFVTFTSFAKNLVSNDASLFVDVFVRDTCFGALQGCTPATSLVSVGPGGVQGSDGSDFSTISADGRFISFASLASNLIPGGTVAGANNVFVRDTCAGASSGCTPLTSLVSVSSAGAQGNADSGLPSISATGRFIAFNSDADNLVSGDTNGATDVFVRDTCFGSTTACNPSTVIVSISTSGTQGNFNSSIAAISADGHFAAFVSGASNLIANDPFGGDFLASTSF